MPGSPGEHHGILGEGRTTPRASASGRSGEGSTLYDRIVIPVTASSEARRPGRARVTGLLLNGAALAFAVSSFSSLALRAEEVTGDRPPLAIYKPNPEPPLETAGTGLGPLVRARLEIDAKGKVAAVTVVSIEPGSPFDSHFRRAAREALLMWRFRPALKGGRPAATALDLAIRFEPRTFTGRPWQRARELSLALEEERYDRRRRFLALPDEQRLRLLEDLTRRAEAQINAARRIEVDSDRFLLVTDAANGNVAERLLRDLEAAFAATMDLFGKRIPAQPAPGKTRAYVYASEQEYANLVAEGEGFEWSSGFYHPAGLLALHLDWPTDDHVLVCLVHEATHALVDRHLVRPGVSLPRWLDEGFAEYMGASRIEEGRLVPGARRTRLRGLRFIPPVEADEAGGQGAGRGGRAGGRLTLADLIASTSDLFYGERREEYYSQAWLAVHYLRHGRKGWDEDEFPRFMLYVAEGFPAGASFQRVYGLDLTELEEEYRRYVDRF